MTPRKKKIRNCICPLHEKMGNVFNPAGNLLNELEIVPLEQDELEAFYLCDGQDLSQEHAGTMMGVSRGTVQRLLAEARKKVVEVLVGQKALVIVGAVSATRQTALNPAAGSHEVDTVVQGANLCRRDDFGPCLGPRNCPWRSRNDGTCMDASA